MKRFVMLLLLFFAAFFYSVSAEEQKDEYPLLPNIFIWQIPEDESVLKDEINEAGSSSLNSNDEEEITLQAEPEEIYVKGYAEYEETADTVYLKDEHNNFVLNLRVPQKLEPKNLSDSKKLQTDKEYSRFNSEEYSIAPQSLMAIEKNGGLSYGTLFKTGIDTSQLERSTTLFTRYEKNKFAISSAYKKNNLTTYGINTDNFYFAPELRLNKFFSISEVLSTDITRNRKAGELVFSISPTKDDRVRFELGAGTTYDYNNDKSWSKFRFSTNFKL